MTDEKIEILTAALKEIVNPLEYMRKRAEAEGARLNGMAYQIANSVSHLQDIAKHALLLIEKMDNGKEEK